MIWQALEMVGWVQWIALAATGVIVAVPVCAWLEARADRRDREDAAAYAEFMRGRR